MLPRSWNRWDGAEAVVSGSCQWPVSVVSGYSVASNEHPWGRTDRSLGAIASRESSIADTGNDHWPLAAAHCPLPTAHCPLFLRDDEAYRGYRTRNDAHILFPSAWLSKDRPLDAFFGEHIE